MVYVVLCVGSARHKSVTVDEFGHLPSGLYTLLTGDVRYSALNPPLANVLASLPVVGLDVEPAFAPPAASDDVFSFWSNGRQFLERQRADYVRIFDAARMVPILLVAALGVLLFFWAEKLAPQSPVAVGALAAGLVLGSPNVIAHARLIGTDTATAVFVALALFSYRGMLLCPSTGRAAVFGVALGLAQLTKFYALLLYPVSLASLFVWHALSGENRPTRAKLLRGFAIGSGVSLLVLNGGYGFAETGSSLRNLTLNSSQLLAWQQGLFGGFPLPLPGAFIRAIDGQLIEVGSGLRSYLMGETFQGGRWDYYLVLLAIKTPLAVLAISACAVAAALRGKRLAPRETVLLLGYPLLLGVVLSLSGNRQLGARALLSAVPLVQLWVAWHFVGLWPVRWRASASGLAVVAVFAVSIIAYPNYLSYFNAFVGGSEEGYRVASDANVDIGQDLPALARYLDEIDAGPVQLYYFGSVDPAIYGIDYVVPSPDRLTPGYLAVSVSLYRIGYDLYDHGEMRRIGPLDVARLGEPIARLGGSIHVYRIPEPIGDAH